MHDAYSSKIVKAANWENLLGTIF